MGQEIFLAVEGLVALVLSIASSVQCSRLLGSQCCDGVYCDEGCCSNQVKVEHMLHMPETRRLMSFLYNGNFVQKSFKSCFLTLDSNCL